MFSAGYELYDIFVQPNIIAFGICFGIASFCACVASTAMAFDTIDRAGKIGIIMVIPSIVLLINLTLPVHYDYVGTSQVDNTQIVNVTKSKENTDNVDLQATYYKLKNGKTYKVYNKDVTRKQAHVKHTVYKFKRSQAKISPIRRLFSTKSVPERVYLTVTEPVK